MDTSQKRKTITVVSILLAVLFFASGVLKWAGTDMQVQNFERWGYPLWFLYLTGFLEMVGGLMLLKAGTRFTGAALLGCVMLGATATHVIHSEAGMAVVPAVLLIALAWLGFASRTPTLDESPAMERRRQVQKQGHTL